MSRAEKREKEELCCLARLFFTGSSFLSVIVIYLYCGTTLESQDQDHDRIGLSAVQTDSPYLKAFTISFVAKGSTSLTIPFQKSVIPFVTNYTRNN